MELRVQEEFCTKSVILQRHEQNYFMRGRGQWAMHTFEIYLYMIIDANDVPRSILKELTSL